MDHLDHINMEMDIAVIGMAGRFPGADDLDAFWQVLKEGKESVTHFSKEQLKEAGVPDELLNDPAYVRTRGTISDPDGFDAFLFDYSPSEAEIIDPQQRVFLETVWQALEHGGYNPYSYGGLIGLFAGMSMNTYLYRYLLQKGGQIGTAEGYQLAIGNDKDFLTTRVSYKLNLRGPSLDLQTACSTSLVAIHVACQNLLNFSCDMALAGGVSVTMPQEQGYLYQEGMILSPDGHCRAFDAKAGGTISGNGVGVVLLKRMEDAIADGDTIHAVIKGSAYNNDGSERVGYTAPSVDGQADVIATAQAISEVEPQSISYIEAHGTGTEMGDPIEIAALTQIFREKTDKKQFCAIGSVKSNIGHLDAAAGVAGFIKTVLALKYGQIPPSVHFEKPNPRLELENSPFFVNDKLRDWHCDEAPRRAAVSSFGIGGTNAHVILQEAPPAGQKAKSSGPYLLALSAKTASALDTATKSLGQFLSQNDIDLADAAYTLSTGRRHFSQRRIAIVKDRDDAAAVLGNIDPKRILNRAHGKDPAPPAVAFMFSGQGAQYVNMGYGIYHSEPVFRKAVDECCEKLRPFLDLDLKELLYPLPGRGEKATEKLNQTRYTQPALFVVEYAMARLLQAYGIEPAAMVGHSIGEYVAAHLSGVLSLDDALKVVAERGRLMQEMPTGSMLSVDMDQQKIAAYISGDISLAAINSRNSSVVSGPDAAIDALQKKLEEQEIGCRKLHTSHAFHSAMMEPAAQKFKEFVKSLTLNTPEKPYLSNLTGNWISAEEAVSADYYAQHLRNAVRFNDNLSHLLQDEGTVLLEVGPGKTLSSLAKRHADAGLGRTIIPTLRHPQDESDDRGFWLQSVGLLWLAGAAIDFKQMYEKQQPRRVPLPGYPFERQRFWLQGADKSAVMPGVSTTTSSDSPGEWFYQELWKQLPHAASKGDSKKLTVFDLSGKCAALFDKAHDYNDLSSQKEIDKNYFKEALSTAGEKQHFLFVADNALSPRKNYNALLALLQSLDSKPASLSLLTQNLFFVLGNEQGSTAAGALTGLLKVAQLELSEFDYRHIDVDDFGNPLLLKELLREGKESSVALRGKKRWTPVFEKTATNALDKIEDQPVIVISGGSGNLASLMVETLSEKGPANFVLVARSLFPAQETWKEIDDSDPGLKRRIQCFQRAIDNGSSLRFFDADVADEPALRSVLDTARDSFGKIDWFIHAAGSVGSSVFQPLSDIGPQDVDRQFRAKVDAVDLLKKITTDYGIKRVILQSSLSTVLGGLGFGHYAAANSYLDAVVHHHGTDAMWQVLDWDGWHFDEGGADHKYGITTQKGRETILRAFGETESARLVVSTADIETRRQEALQQLSGQTGTSQPDNLYQRPNLPTPYAAPETELQKEVAGVWQNLLGIGQIGIYDDFFDLGGNSLMGTQLISRLRDTFKVELPIRALFEDPTISGVCKVIEQEKDSGSGDDDMSRMLKELEEMDSSDVQEMLEKRRNKGDQPEK